MRIPPAPGRYSWAVVDHLKLIPNRPDVRFEHRIHEQILPSVKAAGIRPEFTDLYVTHKNYDRTSEGQALKRRRDARLLKLDLQDRPEHPFTLFNLGMTHLEASADYVVASQYLQRCLDRSHPADSIFAKAFAMLTQALFGQGEAEMAIAANEKGRGFHPDDPELLLLAGKIYLFMQRFSEARLALERLVSGRDQRGCRSAEADLRTCQGPRELALLYHRMGDSPHAEADLRRLAAEQPEYVPAREALVEVLAAQGKKMEARRLLTALPPESLKKPEFIRLQESLTV